jgi:hypothetical protein
MEVIDTRPARKPTAPVPGTAPGDQRRVCSHCGGAVEVITIPRKTAAGRQLPTKIGACVRCAQWFNEAGLGELNRYLPQSES